MPARRGNEQRSKTGEKSATDMFVHTDSPKKTTKPDQPSLSRQVPAHLPAALSALLSSYLFSYPAIASIYSDIFARPLFPISRLSRVCVAPRTLAKASIGRFLTQLTGKPKPHTALLRPVPKRLNTTSPVWGHRLTREPATEGSSEVYPNRGPPIEPVPTGNCVYLF